MKRFVYLFLLAVSISGCAGSENYFPYQAEPIPSARLYGFTKRSDAHLLVVHERSVDAQCPIRILIDGSLAAELESQEVADFGITMGQHWLSTATAYGCPDSSIKPTKIAVKTGDALIIRIDERGFTLVGK